eukprot:s2006_g7.t1
MLCHGGVVCTTSATFRAEWLPGGTKDMSGNVTEEVFCLGDGHVMMNGFQIAIGSTQRCALFLFPGWVVEFLAATHFPDTPAKYFGACFGAFLMPTVIVLLQIVREKVLESSKNSSRTFGLDACHRRQRDNRGFTSKMKSSKLEAMTQEVNGLAALGFPVPFPIFLCICFGFVASFFLLQRYKRYKGVAGEKVAVEGAPCCAV